MVLTKAEQERLGKAVTTDKSGKTRLSASKLGKEARIVMSNKAGVGWTSGSHTALPVLTTSWGKGAENFQGFIDNTDIAKKLKALL